MIEIHNLSKFYPDKCVFENLNFTLPTGVITAFTGASGIGKTTLLRIIAGLEAPSGGSVTGLTQLSKTFVFQENRLIEPISVLKNILAVTDNKEKALSLLEKAGLADEIHTKTAVLSGGMKRRLAIIRALAKGGDFYYLDEPLRELDDNTAEQMLLLLQEELKGKTGILITHDKAHTQRLAQNEIQFCGNPMRVYLMKST